MAREWDYTDTYVAACGKCCSSYMLGIAHERDCHACQSEIRAEEADWDEDDEEEEEDDE